MISTSVSMEPQIKIASPKKLIGIRRMMSLADYNAAGLWQAFMPRRMEIKMSLTRELISLAVYPPAFFSDYQPTTEFEKWVAIEVSDFDDLPIGMEIMELPGGLHAVFHYEGPNTDYAIYQYIYGTWLPGSGYSLDDRPHFEILDANHKKNDPYSEEEIWIPIKIAP